jgi:lipid A 3-O-deacylase
MRSLPVILILSLFLFSCTDHNASEQETRLRQSPVPKGAGKAVHPQARVTAKPVKAATSQSKAQKKRRALNKERIPATPTATRQPDTLLIHKLNRLRTLQVNPDLNEPVTRDYLLSPVDSMPFPSLIELSRERYFRIQFDNDLLDNTDRFYTNGIRLEYICPALSGSPLSKLMIPYWRPGINYYGMSLVQNMYTASKTKVGGILYGDRPFASYLYVSAFKTTNDAIHLLRQTSDLQIGVIGPASLGGSVQTLFHEAVPTNDKPQGWEYQIANDLLLNYEVSYEKGIVSEPNVELNLTGDGIVGTVYTGIKAGFHFRAGAMQPYFKSLGFSKRSVNRRAGMRNTQYYLFLNATGTAVGYDATLQGGMFNHHSAYTIPADSISRFRFSGSAGVVVSYGGARLDVQQHIISPEFTGGLWHLWIGIGLTFSF